MTRKLKPSDHAGFTDLERLQLTLQAANIGTWELALPDQHIVLDERCKALFGFLSTDEITYEQLLARILPTDRTTVDDALQRAGDGQYSTHYAIRFRILTDSHDDVRWLHSRGQALVDDQGKIYRILGIVEAISQQAEAEPTVAERWSSNRVQVTTPAETDRNPARVDADVAEHKNVEKALLESEQRLRSLIESAPFPIAVYVGRRMHIQVANQSIIDIWGKGSDVIGKPYAEVLPELATQAIYDQLDGVYTTGIPFHAKNQRVDLVVNGKNRPYYFKYSFTPLFDADGQVYGVMNTGADVTDLMLAKQQLEEVEQTLRGAIELAELATWSLDITTGVFTYSDRFLDWLGFSEETKALDEAYQSIPVEYRQSVDDAIAAVIQPGSPGIYDNEHPIINRITGQQRIIHAQARIIYSEMGVPVSLTGTAHDVTAQRQLQVTLEQQVQERTEELAATNEELAAINEEYATTNEELIEANGLLTLSNENLQRFAYVASHDLQEPLRKIQQFGDLLKNRYADSLGEGIDYLERMRVAANRMSGLIKDLLTFSRITTAQEVVALVSLTEVVNTILTDLDLRIQETGAVTAVKPLPTVQGDPSQLGQLFQNLLSNALKFRRPEVTPYIQVSATIVVAADLPPTVKPTRNAAAYHCIQVSDNGIGFEEKYVDRIFQVFQRLHGKSQYEGTGIGLAICEKVATNHGGAITATSQFGQGTTFSVYLPI